MKTARQVKLMHSFEYQQELHRRRMRRIERETKLWFILAVVTMAAVGIIAAGIA